MSIVQLQIFSGTIGPVINPNEIETLINSVSAEANAFMGTLAIGNVLKVDASLTAPRSGHMSHYEIVVVYLL